MKQEQFIRLQIDRGEYQTAEDVISEAFKLLCEYIAIKNSKAASQIAPEAANAIAVLGCFILSVFPNIF